MCPWHCLIWTSKTELKAELQWVSDQWKEVLTNDITAWVINVSLPSPCIPTSVCKSLISAAGTQEETAVARLLGPDQGIWIQGEIEEGVAETSTAWQTMRKRLDFIRNVMRDFQQRGDAI